MEARERGWLVLVDRPLQPQWIPKCARACPIEGDDEGHTVFAVDGKARRHLEIVPSRSRLLRCARDCASRVNKQFVGARTRECLSADGAPFRCGKTPVAAAGSLWLSVAACPRI